MVLTPLDADKAPSTGAARKDPYSTVVGGAYFWEDAGAHCGQGTDRAGGVGISNTQGNTLLQVKWAPFSNY